MLLEKSIFFVCIVNKEFQPQIVVFVVIGASARNFDSLFQLEADSSMTYQFRLLIDHPTISV